jgi:hypothetical protein
MHQRWINPALIALSVFALLAQLVLTAGHLHLAGLASGDSAVVVAARASGGPGTPPTPPSDDEARCPLCWAHAVSGSLVLPPAIDLPPPALSLAASLQLPADAPVIGAAARPFHPRAPPCLTV